MPPRLEIWSGGQTGVDRAALDVAQEFGLPIGGWIPRGRVAEDGVVPARYEGLREADSPDYARRTQLNVEGTDATLVLRMGAATGGTLETVKAAQRLKRPMLAIDLSHRSADASIAVKVWLDQLFGSQPAIRLNVAGPRASQAPHAYRLAQDILRDVLASYAAV